MRFFKKSKKKLLNKKGSFSIEAVIAMMAILMVTFLGIAYFAYLIPRQMITQEVQALTQVVKMQGGLTQSDVAWFQERMEERGVDGERVTVIATAEKRDISGAIAYKNRDVSNVEDLSLGFVGGERVANSINYSPRDSKEIITVKVQVPSNNNFINAISRFWKGSGSSLGDYTFRETVMSERW